MELLSRYKKHLTNRIGPLLKQIWNDSMHVILYKLFDMFLTQRITRYRLGRSCIARPSTWFKSILGSFYFGGNGQSIFGQIFATFSAETFFLKNTFLHDWRMERCPRVIWRFFAWGEILFFGILWLEGWCILKRQFNSILCIRYFVATNRFYLNERPNDNHVIFVACTFVLTAVRPILAKFWTYFGQF